MMIDPESPTQNPFVRADRGQCPDMDCAGSLRLKDMLNADIYLYSCRACGHEIASSSVLPTTMDA